ncbi:2'-5' RNA ligase family protein [Kitasatospora nipponensis]|uniref:2'-5' RNA ligase family protein n=1 Tax=Kitasatospora nipponensis TaxID=258049 RepID=A0ABN1VYK2_9ACTN
MSVTPPIPPPVTSPTAGHGTDRFQAGQSGLVVRIPAGEPAVRAWRERLDPSARAGVPAHVTVLFPFLDESRLDATVHAALAGTVAAHPAFEVRFARCERFPGVLFLVPEPDLPFRRLTEAIVERWPEAPPFGGRFDDNVPHLTLAQHEDGAVLDEVEAGVGALLPVTARVASVELLVHDGTAWQARASFPLLG